ncbi:MULTISPECIES: PTS sugar transporter subunit IIA [unclassified Anaerobiospirillum]|uniref:PTS sugar transporter subunit IIA n=1 Tax=unclassified Anaerobiospirillum TaxID=2647410 RepID=UPI001FF62F44|nr:MULTISPECIES: PTS sugar transporter subunit IIA [unclassified Anaerobiospirillum]MCK0525467.1 PTS sugar transporter subunit IIA [Anaerobiospirillum sp. NML120449]MCK0534116.1 PTS sugar transporter subunit IIA [Anaerobiospirillum sp. NML120511]MCK0539339.1 PTS sugar transporter subunit IIA [Anaerobiospirillum sp. NML02-A-032]
MAQFKILPTTWLLSPLTCFSRKRLFEEICSMVSTITDISPNVLLKALNEREAMGSTVCARGISIPHAVVEDLESSLMVLTILHDEVSYNPVDTDYMGVDMALAFFISPKDDYETVEQMLRLVSKELNNTELANSIRRVWQDNAKLMLMMQKLDSLLYQELKDSVAEKQSSAPSSATNVIMQFISDAINN